MCYRRWLAVVTLAVCTNCWANEAVTQIMSGPWGMVLSLGRWLIVNSDKVYEVRVEGRGDSPEQARENGWRLAVARAVGTINLRQSETTNGDLVLDRQLLYSSGYVKDWRELRQYRTAQGQWAVEMDVWVRHSSIADGLVGESTSPQQFSGAQQAAQLTSRNRERQQAHQLLVAVLDQWPNPAVTIMRSGPMQTEYLSDRGVQLVIPQLTVGMSPAYQRSLYEVLDKISAQPGRDYHAMVYDQDLVRREWLIRDQLQVQAIEKAFDRMVVVRVTMFQGITPILWRCWDMKLERQGHELPNQPKTWKKVTIPVTQRDLLLINRVVFDIVSPELCR